VSAAGRIVSGMRPTGRLHLGHLLGTLRTWCAVQATHECFFFVADWHALTTDYDRTEGLTTNVVEMVTDWLASGVDPARATVFVQSAVPEHAELHLLLSMITPLGWLERVPTYKETQQQLVDRDLSTYGFLGYPVLQAADILMYKATTVPVGADQVPHVELTREIARRFNHVFGELFPEPQAMLAAAPRVPGLDGRKMSKSYNNAVYLADEAAEVDAKLSKMMTDPRRARRRDPGPRRLPGVHAAPHLLHSRGARVHGGGMPNRRHRLPRVQEDHDRARRSRARTDSRTTPGARRAAGRRPGRDRRGEQTRADDRSRDDGRGPPARGPRQGSVTA
jgi:tryptophanyl-tRNA synthetase